MWLFENRLAGYPLMARTLRAAPSSRASRNRCCPALAPSIKAVATDVRFADTGEPRDVRRASGKIPDHATSGIVQANGDNLRVGEMEPRECVRACGVGMRSVENESVRETALVNGGSENPELGKRAGSCRKTTVLMPVALGRPA